MFKYGMKSMKCRIMFLCALIACLLFFGGTRFISVLNASAGSEHPKGNQASQESVYTIQTDSFKDSLRAEKKFRIIEQSLEGTAFQALRIEKIGRFYAVRVGRFGSLAEAEHFLRKHKRSLERSMVMKAYFIDERILQIHDGVEEYVLVSKARIQRNRYLPDLPYARNDLGLKLVGTALVDEPENNIAIIENLASGDQEIYKTGDTLKGVLIKRILSRGVIIDEGRGDEILIMVRGTNTRTLQSESQRVQLGKKVVDADKSDDNKDKDNDKDNDNDNDKDNDKDKDDDDDDDKDKGD
jgi:hypothetical protein